MTKLAKTILAGSIGVAALSGVSHAQTQPQPVKNILLVHGAFADGTSWGKVIPILQARGWTGDPGRSLLGRCCDQRGRR